MLFQHSDWTQPGWPDLRKSHQTINALVDTVRALRILFALFYGAKLSSNQVVGMEEVSLSGIHNIGEVVDLVSTVCAYAEYFECGEHIKAGMIRAMQSAPGYWVAVADDPKRHVALAIRLQLREVYWDALRHLVAPTWNDSPSSDVDWSDVAEAMGKYETEVHSLFQPQMEELPGLVAQLNQDLLKLSLEPVRACYGGWYTAFTTFWNALQFKKPDRSQATKANEAAALVARGLWSQFYIGSFYGEELEMNNYKGKVVPKKDSL